MTHDVADLAHEALRRHARAPAGPLPPETRLADVITSLQLIVAILELERALGRRPFEVSRTGALATVRDFVDAVVRGGQA